MTDSSSTTVDHSVLVAFATRHGATPGVAERIAARLSDAGLAADLSTVARVDDVGAYDAVVFGSPVYDQVWPPEGEAFVRDNADALTTRPVWMFSVGSFGDHKPLIGPLMKREPKRIDEVRKALHPREYRVFAGVIRRHQWPLRSRLFFHALGGQLGDNRDWADIDAWAASIARSLGAKGMMPKRRTRLRLRAIHRLQNPVVRVLLRSPLRGPLAKSLTLLSYTGRRSGKRYTIPVMYDRDDGVVVVFVGWPEEKRWWRNLLTPAPVGVLLDGRERDGTGHAIVDDSEALERGLEAYRRRFPRARNLRPDDAVMVRIKLAPQDREQSD